METRDVSYFRQLLQNEKQYLLQLCQNWEKVCETNTEITEEISGQIRTTLGQTHLLINQRFKQFSGLIDDCEFKRSDKEMTCNDLQGFWDMIYYQVIDIHEKFKKLEALKNNNWENKEDKKVNKTDSKKPIPENKVKRKVLQSSALKNHIQEARKKMNQSSKIYPVKSFDSQDKENINFFTLSKEKTIENNT